MFNTIRRNCQRETLLRFKPNRKCDLFDSRDEIAGCIEKAYEQIQFSEATRVLFFTSKKEMTEYAKKVR